MRMTFKTWLAPLALALAAFMPITAGAASLYVPKWTQFADDNGDPCNGCFLYFYTTTTTTPKNTYPSEANALAGTSANVNPVVLDADGRSPVEIWISGRYRLITKTAAAVTIADDDPIEDTTPGSGGQTGAPLFGGNNTGSANALAFAYSPTLTTYTNGQVLRGRITADNSTAVTVNADGVGVKSLVKQDGTALIAGDLQGPGIISFAYDSATNVFRLQSPDGHLFRDGTNVPARADVASATTTNLDTAGTNYVRITGTTGITAFTLTDGRWRDVVFGGALTMTNGASLILPGGKDITTVAGDMMRIVGESAGVVRIQNFQRGALPPAGIICAGGNVAAPVDATEDALATCTIPGNAMGANGQIRLTGDIRVNNNVNVKTLRIRYSGGAGTLLVTQAMTSTTGWLFTGNLYNKNATNAQTYFGTLSQRDGVAGAVSASIGAGGANVQTTTQDSTASASIVITCQKATAGDTCVLDHYAFELLPSP